MESSEWLAQVRVLYRPPNLFRIFAFAILVDLIALVLGFAFLLIMNGLLMGFIRIAIYWQPAWKLLIRFLGIQNTSTVLSPPNIRWWQYITISIHVGLRITLIGVGIWMLHRTGFCGQNLICMLMGD
jgi:hypothetical protein